MSQDFPRLDNIQADERVLAFAMAASLLSVLAFGLLPALRLSSTPARQVLDSKGPIGSGRPRMRNALVGVQTAVSLVLLVAAGLLLRSYAALGRVDPGFEPGRVLTMETWLPMPNNLGQGPYARPGDRVALFAEALERMRRLPQVRDAGLTAQLPLSGSFHLPVAVDEVPRDRGTEMPTAEYRVVSDGYFAALGIDLVSGRTFRPEDRLGAPQVALVSRAFAERHFPGVDPVGKDVRIGGPWLPWAQIVGVVDDVRNRSLDHAFGETVYRTFRQAEVGIQAMTFVLRTTNLSESVAGSATEALQSVDPGLPAFFVTPMEEVVAGARSQHRVLATLFALFGLQTLVLSALGIYGVVSFAVTRRTREIGIRLALGGAPRGILRMLLGEGVRLGLQGAGVGLVLALGLSRALAVVLFEVGPQDPGSFAGAGALALVVVLLASLVPALQAMRVDPAQTIKAD